MSAFESKDAYYDFVKTVLTDRRFIFDGKAGKFLEAVRAASKSRAYSLKSGRKFYRAQVGSDFGIRPSEDGEDGMGVEEEIPLPEARMIPDPQYVTSSGRANPAGFSYLYLATTPETAMAEVRPSLEQSLTIALFEIQKDVNVVVCQAGVENWGERIFEENPSAEKLGIYIWNDISRAFSRPVNREDQESAYLPTQILAEVFKAEGFDGVAYRSRLGSGTNVVLFDMHIARQIRRYVYTLKKVRYDFEAAPNLHIYREKDGVGEHVTEIHSESAPWPS